MIKRTLVLAAAVSIFSMPVKAQNFGLERPLSTVEVPEVSPAAPDLSSLSAEYAEFFSALNSYSNTAFMAPQGSPEAMQASAAGQYLRGRVEELGARIKALGGSVPSVPATRGASFSWRVSSELNDVFGFGGPAGRSAAPGVEIRAGYCRINFVKEGVPFLVQSDRFLKKGEVIITFDDGPGPLTEEVSAAMKANNAPSVFFVLGSKLNAAGKARVKAEAADGNFPGVHGYWHATENGKPLTAYSTAKILDQLGGVSDSIKSATGAKPVFFRPPYGIITPDALKALSSDLGLVPVGWTIDTLDWSTKDPEALFEKTVSMIKQRGKGIILMHDIHPQSRTAAKRLAAWLAENGYKVVSPERLAEAYRGE